MEQGYGGEQNYRNKAFSGAFTGPLVSKKRALLSPIALPHGVLWGRSLLLCLLLFQYFRVYSEICSSKTPFTQNLGFPCISCIPTTVLVDFHTFPRVFHHLTVGALTSGPLLGQKTYASCGLCCQSCVFKWGLWRDLFGTWACCVDVTGATPCKTMPRQHKNERKARKHALQKRFTPTRKSLSQTESGWW